MAASGTTASAVPTHQAGGACRVDDRSEPRSACGGREVYLLPTPRALGDAISASLPGPAACPLAVVCLCPEGERGGPPAALPQAGAALAHAPRAAARPDAELEAAAHGIPAAVARVPHAGAAARHARPAAAVRHASGRAPSAAAAHG